MVVLVLKKPTTRKEFEEKYESVIHDFLRCITIHTEYSDRELEDRYIDSVCGYLYNPEELKKHPIFEIYNQ